MWWQTLVVALGSSLVGGGLTAGGTFVVFRRQERAALAREVRGRLGVFLGALTLAVSFLQQLPEAPPDPSLARFIPQGAVPGGVRRWWAAYRWTKQRRRLHDVFGDQPFLPAERVVIAVAPLLVLPLPTQLSGAIQEALDYVAELGLDRSDQVKAKWPRLYERLIDLAHEYLADADELVRALRGIGEAGRR